MISALAQTVNGTTVTFVPAFPQSLATQLVGSVNYRLSNNPWAEKTVRIPIGPPGIFNITVGTTQAMRVPIRLLCSYVRRPAEIITYRIVDGFNTAFGTLNQAIFRGVRLATPNDSFADQNFVVGPAFENGVVNDLWGRLYYQPAPKYHGRFGFSYDCYDHKENLPSVPGFVNVTVIPQIPCNDRIEINSDYIKIYNGDPIADGLVFRFFEFPQDAMFMSADSSIPAYRINTTTRYRENRVRLIANITRGRPFVGNYLYQAIGADNLTSNFCNVTFVVSCAPLYLNIFNKSSVSICETCPVGAICSFNGLFEPYAARGYWKALDSMVFLPCEPASACPGFSNATVCAEGYTGTRCGECSQNFYRLGGDCRKCTNNIGVLITLIILLLFGAFALISLVLRYVANGWILGVATICLNFTQMILVLSEIKMKWTPEFQQFMNTISIANLNIELASPECFITDSASNYYFKMKVTLALPLFLSLPLILWTLIHLWPIRSSIIYACRWLAKRVRIRYNPVINLVALKQSQAENLLIATRAMNALLSVVYVIVATKSLALFDCTQEVNDTFYLDEDSSVKCFDDLWYSNLSYVLPAALFYAFGIPLYFSILFFLLFQRRWSGPTWTRLRKLAEAVFNFDYSFIKAERQYFIVLQILQKFIVICINMFFTKYVTLQITLTICVLIGSYQVYRRQQPYRYKSLHYLEVCSIFSAIAILAVGNFLYTEQFPAESHQQVVSAILIAIISVFFGAAVLAIMYEVKTGMKTRKQSSTSSLSLSSSLKNAKNEKQMKDTESTPTRPLEISNAVLIESTAGLPMMTASKFLYNRTVDRLPPKE
ncbi:hypothetical protein BKA69DRAFT_1085893 [Paraphysoderma sedebokerense]|nr:hypothetical protein BKA69DRAFT_1085893 [Paraphysoderma sedebokerense]